MRNTRNRRPALRGIIKSFKINIASSVLSHHTNPHTSVITTTREPAKHSNVSSRGYGYMSLVWSNLRVATNRFVPKKAFQKFPRTYHKEEPSLVMCIYAWMVWLHDCEQGYRLRLLMWQKEVHLVMPGYIYFRNGLWLGQLKLVLKVTPPFTY